MPIICLQYAENILNNIENMGKYAYNMCEIRREYPMIYAEIYRSKWQTSNLTNTRIARTGEGRVPHHMESAQDLHQPLQL